MKVKKKIMKIIIDVGECSDGIVDIFYNDGTKKQYNEMECVKPSLKERLEVRKFLRNRQPSHFLIMNSPHRYIFSYERGKGK